MPETYEFEQQYAGGCETSESEKMTRSLSPRFVRLSTLMFLPVWIVALVCCSLESLRGHCHMQGAHAEDENAGSHGGPHHDSPAKSIPNEAPHSEGFCNSLASTVLTSAFVHIPVPPSQWESASDWTALPTLAENFPPCWLFPPGRKMHLGLHTRSVYFLSNRSHAPPPIA